MMYKLSHTCNLSLGKFYITVQLWLRMMLEWISEPLVFGDVHITRLSLMYVFSTVLLQLISPQPLLQPFVGMRVRSAVPMRSVFVKSSMLALLLWFFSVLVAWARLLPQCISTWHTC